MTNFAFACPYGIHCSGLFCDTPECLNVRIQSALTDVDLARHSLIILARTIKQNENVNAVACNSLTFIRATLLAVQERIKEDDKMINDAVSSMRCCLERAEKFKSKHPRPGTISNGAEACTWITSELDGRIKLIAAAFKAVEEER